MTKEKPQSPKNRDSALPTLHLINIHCLSLPGHDTRTCKRTKGRRVPKPGTLRYLLNATETYAQQTEQTINQELNGGPNE